MNLSFVSAARLQQVGRGLVVPLLLMVAWWGMARWELIPTMFLPSPGRVVAAFFNLWGNGTLPYNLKVSFARFLVGALLGVTGGCLLGLLFGLSATLERLLAPFFNAVRQVPLLAWVPLIILGFGIAEASKICFIAIGTAFPMVLSTFDGIRNVRKEYLEVGRIVGFGRFDLAKQIILPSILPPLTTGLRMSLNIAWGQLVAAELFMSTSAGGIGNMIGQGRTNWRMDIVMVGILVIGLVGYALDHGAKVLENHFSHWRNV